MDLVDDSASRGAAEQGPESPQHLVAERRHRLPVGIDASDLDRAGPRDQLVPERLKPSEIGGGDDLDGGVEPQRGEIGSGLAVRKDDERPERAFFLVHTRYEHAR